MKRNNSYQILREILRIYKAHKSGQGISWGELAFLQDNQGVIKSTFPGDVELLELAGISEKEATTCN